MRKNIELKARLRSLDRARAIAQQLATEALPDQHQVDTYFSCHNGRLKMREINGSSAELIWYRREDVECSKASNYQIVPIAQPKLLKQVLAGALGVWTIVDKQRSIWLVDNVRIHLDCVKGLGDFLEFEAVLSAAQTEEVGHRQLAELRASFGLAADDLVAGSYSDMARCAGS